MSVGSWTPGSEPVLITRDLLSPIFDLVLDDELPSKAPSDLSPLQGLAKSTLAQWIDVAEQLSSDEVRHLIRFFTLAEWQWSEWQGGDQNPVISLCKILKQRGDFPDKALTLWIKSHTENRFLPYGNPLA